MDKMNIFSLAVEAEAARYLEIGGVSIEIYPTPSTQDILEAIQWGLNLTIQGNEVVSEAIKKIFLDMSMVKAFTNLDVDISEKTVEEVYQMYDIIYRSGVVGEIESKANKLAVAFLKDGFNKTVDGIIAYQQSAAGILQSLTNQASQSTEEMEKNLAFASNPDNLEPLTKMLSVAEKLGYNPA